MRGSAAPLWEKKLRLFSETLDVWLAVQRAWMYLESIFKAADIQRQLPNEYKDFDRVNKMWLGLMKGCTCVVEKVVLAADLLDHTL